MSAATFERPATRRLKNLTDSELLAFDTAEASDELALRERFAACVRRKPDDGAEVHWEQDNHRMQFVVQSSRGQYAECIDCGYPGMAHDDLDRLVGLIDSGYDW